MKILIFLALLFTNFQLLAISPWLKNIDDKNKQEQLDLRWVASGGEADFQFLHEKLQLMNVELTPKPVFPSKPWSQNHLVYEISKTSSLKMQVPYGSIEKVTNSGLEVNTNFSLGYKNKTIKITKLTFIHNPKKDSDFDIVNFKLYDQDGHHVFNTNNIHIQYSKDKKLMNMKHMDISASKTLAKLLLLPNLAGQILGQVHTYSYLSIPKNAQFQIKGGNCLTNPSFQNTTNFTDIELVGMPSTSFTDAVNWLGTVNGTDYLILAPSAELLNVGTADVPWWEKLSGTFAPYNNDQHPYLVWDVYREIDNRFEQVAQSGLKHAFFSTNVNCSCPGGNILGTGCGDIYGVGSNNRSDALGLRPELESFSGLWDSCGSFFDPDCVGPPGPSPEITSGSTSTGENRLTLDPNDIVPNLYMQAWYVVRDDINIFNSMGYKRFSPTFSNNIWSMNTSATFNSGPAIYNYVPKNTMNLMQASQTLSTNEGHLTVAVKVIELGGGLYRYNYAIENYDFDPQLNVYHIPFDTSASLSDTVFVDPDKNASNNWSFSRTGNVLNIAENVSNSQDWGQLFSFSFTTNIAPAKSNIVLGVANPINNSTISALSLAPINLFSDGFEQ